MYCVCFLVCKCKFARSSNIPGTDFIQILPWCAKVLHLIPDVSAVHDNRHICTGIFLFSVRRTHYGMSLGKTKADPSTSARSTYYGPRPERSYSALSLLNRDYVGAEWYIQSIEAWYDTMAKQYENKAWRLAATNQQKAEKAERSKGLFVITCVHSSGQPLSSVPRSPSSESDLQ